jgi:hypothetical protein
LTSPGLDEEEVIVGAQVDRDGEELGVSFSLSGGSAERVQHAVQAIVVESHDLEKGQDGREGGSLASSSETYSQSSLSFFELAKLRGLGEGSISITRTSSSTSESLSEEEEVSVVFTERLSLGLSTVPTADLGVSGRSVKKSTL